MPRLGTLARLAHSSVTALITLASLASSANAGPSDGTWNLLAQPRERFGQTTVHDPVRDRLIMFGGAASFTGLNTAYGDLWKLDLIGSPVWGPLTTANPGPASRYGHTMVYDPVRDRLLVFGGYNNSMFFNDVWSLSLSDPPTWTALAPIGTPPSVRYGHVGAYDPVSDRMLVFGGQTTGGAYQNDLWSLSLSGTPAWVQLAPAGPVPPTRRVATWVLDPAQQRLVLFGGYRGTYLDDVWTLSLDGTLAWSSITAGGTGPGPRAFHSATFDAARDEMVVYGGSNGSNQGDAFRLSFAGSPTWSALAPSGAPPGARIYHTAVRDPIRDRDVVFGGLSTALLGDAWALDRQGSPAWVPVLPASQAPLLGRRASTLVLDPVRDRLLMFGGATQLGDPVDLWEKPLGTGESFRPLPFTGVPPQPNLGLGRAAIYDPIRDRVLVYGASTPGPGRVWQLSLMGTPAWTELMLPGTPSARTWHTAVYDPSRDRMIVYGGHDQAYGDETWVLDLASMTWTELFAPNAPPGHIDHSAIWDGAHDQMVVFGVDAMGDNHIWALRFTPTPVWVPFSITDPSPRSSSVAVHDASRDRMVVFGGNAGGTINNEVWELPLAPGSLPSLLSTSGVAPSARVYSGGVYDAARDRMLVFGGSAGLQVYFNELWSLQWTGVVGVDPQPVVREGSRVIAYPNPSRTHVDIAFTLATNSRVQVGIYDVSGRLVQVIADGRLVAGPQSLRWDRRTLSGRQAPAGLYFLQVRTERETFSRRLVLTE